MAAARETGRIGGERGARIETRSRGRETRSGSWGGRAEGGGRAKDVTGRRGPRVVRTAVSVGGCSDMGAE